MESLITTEDYFPVEDHDSLYWEFTALNGDDSTLDTLSTPIDCFSLSGDLISTFRSVVDVSTCLNIEVPKIVSSIQHSKVLRGVRFGLSFSPPQNVDFHTKALRIASIKSASYDIESHTFDIDGDAVDCYNTKGDFLFRFRNIEDAARSLSIDEQRIRKICSFLKRQAYGLNFNLSPHQYVEMEEEQRVALIDRILAIRLKTAGSLHATAKSSSKTTTVETPPFDDSDPIDCYTTSWDHLFRFKNLADVETSLSIDGNLVRKVCQKQKKTVCGLKFDIATEPYEELDEEVRMTILTRIKSLMRRGRLATPVKEKKESESEDSSSSESEHSSGSGYCIADHQHPGERYESSLRRRLRRLADEEIMAQNPRLGPRYQVDIPSIQIPEAKYRHRQYSSPPRESRVIEAVEDPVRTVEIATTFDRYALNDNELYWNEEAFIQPEYNGKRNLYREYEEKLKQKAKEEEKQRNEMYPDNRLHMMPDLIDGDYFIKRKRDPVKHEALYQAYLRQARLRYLRKGSIVAIKSRTDKSIPAVQYVCILRDYGSANDNPPSLPEVTVPTVESLLQELGIIIPPKKKRSVSPTTAIPTVSSMYWSVDEEAVEQQDGHGIGEEAHAVQAIESSVPSIDETPVEVSSTKSQDGEAIQQSDVDESTVGVPMEVGESSMAPSAEGLSVQDSPSKIEDDGDVHCTDEGDVGVKAPIEVEDALSAVFDILQSSDPAASEVHNDEPASHNLGVTVVHSDVEDSNVTVDPVCTVSEVQDDTMPTANMTTDANGNEKNDTPTITSAVEGLVQHEQDIVTSESTFPDAPQWEGVVADTQVIPSTKDPLENETTTQQTNSNVDSIVVDDSGNLNEEPQPTSETVSSSTPVSDAQPVDEELEATKKVADEPYANIFSNDGVNALDGVLEIDHASSYGPQDDDAMEVTKEVGRTEENQAESAMDANDMISEPIPDVDAYPHQVLVYNGRQVFLVKVEDIIINTDDELIQLLVDARGDTDVALKLVDEMVARLCSEQFSIDEVQAYLKNVAQYKKDMQYFRKVPLLKRKSLKALVDFHYKYYWFSVPNLYEVVTKSMLLNVFRCADYLNKPLITPPKKSSSRKIVNEVVADRPDSSDSVMDLTGDATDKAVSVSSVELTIEEVTRRILDSFTSSSSTDKVAVVDTPNNPEDSLIRELSSSHYDLITTMKSFILSSTYNQRSMSPAVTESVTGGDETRGVSSSTSGKARGRPRSNSTTVSAAAATKKSKASDSVVAPKKVPAAPKPPVDPDRSKQIVIKDPLTDQVIQVYRNAIFCGMDLNITAGEVLAYCKAVKGENIVNNVKLEFYSEPQVPIDNSRVLTDQLTTFPSTFPVASSTSGAVSSGKKRKFVSDGATGSSPSQVRPAPIPVVPPVAPPAPPVAPPATPVAPPVVPSVAPPVAPPVNPAGRALTPAPPGSIEVLPPIADSVGVSPYGFEQPTENQQGAHKVVFEMFQSGPLGGYTYNELILQIVQKKPDYTIKQDRIARALNNMMNAGLLFKKYNNKYVLQRIRSAKITQWMAEQEAVNLNMDQLEKLVDDNNVVGLLIQLMKQCSSHTKFKLSFFKMLLTQAKMPPGLVHLPSAALMCVVQVGLNKGVNMGLIRRDSKDNMYYMDMVLVSRLVYPPVVPSASPPLSSVQYGTNSVVQSQMASQIPQALPLSVSQVSQTKGKVPKSVVHENPVVYQPVQQFSHEPRDVTQIESQVQSSSVTRVDSQSHKPRPKKQAKSTAVESASSRSSAVGAASAKTAVGQQESLSDLAAAFYQEKERLKQEALRESFLREREELRQLTQLSQSQSMDGSSSSSAVAPVSANVNGAGASVDSEIQDIDSFIAEALFDDIGAEDFTDEPKEELYFDEYGL